MKMLAMAISGMYALKSKSYRLKSKAFLLILKESSCSMDIFKKKRCQY